MATVTTTYLDKKLNEQLEAVIGVMKQGFDEQAHRMDRIEANLASLASSVDRFVKMITDQGQEVIVLRKQLRDAENRIKQLEMKPGAV